MGQAIIAGGQHIFGFRYTLPNRGLAYYFMRVAPAKKIMLMRLLAEDVAVNLPDYGEVPFSGYGEPPYTLLKQLRDEYGADV